MELNSNCNGNDNDNENNGRSDFPFLYGNHLRKKTQNKLASFHQSPVIVLNRKRLEHIFKTFSFIFLYFLVKIMFVVG